jgi:hypothetical protein
LNTVGLANSTYWAREYAKLVYPCGGTELLNVPTINQITRKDGQYFIDGKATGVAANTASGVLASSTCDATKYYCSAGTVYGSGADQLKAVFAAFQNGGRHPAAPVVASSAMSFDATNSNWMWIILIIGALMTIFFTLLK